MIYAIFSDIHSNIEAFDVVIKFYKDLKNVEAYLFCGDIVGYGPKPNECLEKIKKLKNLYLVLGNHDAALVGKKNINWFNEYARETIVWTKKVLNKENIDFLNSVVETVSMNDITLVHGSPTKPLDEYIFSSEQCLNNMEKFSTRICFCGHTHQPFIFEFSEDEKFKFIVPVFEKDSYEFQLNKDSRYIINVGSVGQPRDWNSKSCCVVYDDKTDKLFFQRLKYDIETTKKEMLNFGLPKFLVQRLSLGQ